MFVVYNVNTVQVGAYLCMRVKLGELDSGSSQVDGCEGGRSVA